MVSLGTDKAWMSMGDNSGGWSQNHLSMVKKNPVTTSTQVKNTLQEVSESGSKSTIKRRLHERKHKGFSKRCKPSTSLKVRKARIDFDKKKKSQPKKPAQFWSRILWTDETKINLYQNGRGRFGEELEQLIIQSASHLL